MVLIFTVFILFAAFIFMIFNHFIYLICIKRSIPEERQKNIFRKVNISLTILLISSYWQVFWAQI